MTTTRRAALIGGAALITGTNVMTSEPQATALEGSYHPANRRQNSGIEGVAGVSVRFECAMRAMQGIMIAEPQNLHATEQIVKRAFEIADAMIAREKAGK
jgi:hypothetical protein